MRNNRDNKRLLIAGLIGFLVFVIVNWYPAFTGEPIDGEALKPPIGKEKAADVAAAYVESLGAEGPFERFVMFQSDMTLGGYLQKNDLAAQYNKTFGNLYPVDYYQVEIASGERIWLVDVHMHESRVIGWRETTAKGAPPDAAAAEQLALRYAADLGFDPQQLRAVSSDNDRIVYRVIDQAIGEAGLQLHVEFGALGVAAINPQFDVPASHVEWYDKQREWMDMVGLVSLGLYMATAGAAIIFAIVYRGAIAFRRGILLTLVFIVLMTINSINTYPVTRMLYPGQPDSELFAVIGSVLNYLFTFVLAAALYFGLVSGDAFFRARGMNLWPRWREDGYGAHVLGAMWRGYALCFILLGAQGIMYLIGEQFLGVWAVNDPSFSIHNLLYPALFPLTAWVAGISEEAIYRVFGIALFRKLFRSTAVAVVLSSLIWAIAHVGYPIFPAYTRVVEVTILGLLFSWVYLRYGFAAAVFAHATFDSILMALSLMSMGGTDDVLLGVLYIVLPALIGYLIYRLHGRTHGRRAPLAPR